MSSKTTHPRSAFLAVNPQRASLPERIYLATGITLAYVVFALGCCVLMLLTPFICWREKEEAARILKLRAWVSRLCRWYLNYCTALKLVSVNFHDPRRLGPGLIVANHPSLVDFIWILATQQNVCCILKADLERLWLFRYLVENLNYISNKDPEQLLHEASERLAQGETMLVFPEATRTLPRTLPKFRLGAAELIVRANVPVFPVVIHKAGAYLSKARPGTSFRTAACIGTSSLRQRSIPTPGTIRAAHGALSRRTCRRYFTGR